MNRPQVDRRPWAVFIVAAVAVVVGQGPVAAQTVVLNDGFESYATGLLVSQGGWTSIAGNGPGPTVVSSPVRTGARALLVPLDTPNYPLGGSDAIALFQLPAHSQLGRFEVDVRKQNSLGNYLYVRLRAGTSPPTFAQGCDLVFSNNGEIRWFGAAYPFTPLTIPTTYNGGQWYRVRIDWFANSTADIYIDGVLSAAGFPFWVAAPGGINWVGVAVGGSGGSNVEQGWCDNAKVSVFDYTPVAAAPSTWGALKASFR